MDQVNARATPGERLAATVLTIVARRRPADDEGWTDLADDIARDTNYDRSALVEAWHRVETIYGFSGETRALSQSILGIARSLRTDTPIRRSSASRRLPADPRSRRRRHHPTTGVKDQHPTP